ncbi:uncharacterized protein BP01DRAFT_389245 [Aspergillus saccharolyticus JOP 1030-1]|uniref:Uncharacterized protein n=1 Tax=Aspergillus saccharolyticus JOP 1030-1 TaxID=1450539 RepID=A0A318ZMD9_9EURO|nr:hypothetical protein BP01DRAFT_389245 [Aspergillus saccharolyticus JOP 1030-1]PYH48656.1 hypothetical protein BP01DRAFT_389245 [Aspergillus saccharolyticus JOP 1030-1]
MVAHTGGLTNGHPGSVRSRNIALLSIFGVIAGAALVFRAQSPSKNEKIYSQKEAQTMVGGQTGENRVGRAPSHQPKN